MNSSVNKDDPKLLNKVFVNNNQLFDFFHDGHWPSNNIDVLSHERDHT